MRTLQVGKLDASLIPVLIHWVCGQDKLFNYSSLGLAIS